MRIYTMPLHNACRPALRVQPRQLCLRLLRRLRRQQRVLRQVGVVRLRRLSWVVGNAYD